MMNNRPIGVFDSGLGGLTVLKELVKILPDEDYVYLGDNLRMPYGAKTDEEIERFTVNSYKFLKTKGIKAMVIACNTATAMGLEAVREIADIPVIGVIEPGAKSAISKGKSEVGIIATDATIRSKVYENLIKEQLPESKIYGVGAPDLVLAVEAGNAENEIGKGIVKRYMDEFPNNLEVVVLACTHFPAAMELFEDYLNTNEKDVIIVDPAAETAKALNEILDKLGSKKGGNTEGNKTFYVTTRPDDFKNIGNMILNNEPKIEKVEVVEI